MWLLSLTNRCFIYTTLLSIASLAIVVGALPDTAAVQSKVSDKSQTEKATRRNYASSDCAKVVETNPEAKKVSHVINEFIDEYMLNPCKTKIWFVIELCDAIETTNIEIANYELFSSTLKDFTVYFSDKFPSPDWKVVGKFTASDSRTLQSFDLNQVGFGKYIKVELFSHYGNEHYCPISVVKVYGKSMAEVYEEKGMMPDDDMKDSKDLRATNPVGNASLKYENYKKILLNSHKDTCDLSDPVQGDEIFPIPNYHRVAPSPVPPIHILPQPTQQPATNNSKSGPLKPSIFVELSNKVKTLEQSTNGKIESIERRLHDFEAKLDGLYLEFKSKTDLGTLTIIVIFYCVYKLMLDLL